MTADYRQNPTPETNVPVVFSKPVLPLLPSFSPCLQHGYDFPRRGDFTAKEYVMNVNFNSLFEIYPDTLRKGAVVGFTKPDGSMLEFPCTLETGDAVMDAKGRWTASGLGLKPVIAKYTGALERTKAVEAWIGDGFCKDPDDKEMVANATLEHVRFVDGVTSIGKAAFWGCYELTSIVIPNTVTEIGDHAFSYCSGLTSITIPEGVTSIGSGAFDGCYSLTGIRIPGTVTEIRNWTFQDCKNLTEITIPNSVTEIGYFVFHGCHRMNVYVDQPQRDLLNNAVLPAGCIVHWNQTEAV